MTPPASTERHDRSTGPVPPRVGLFGLLGAGNVGNDGSMEVMLEYLRTEHPDATIDAMCSGPETLKRKYGIDAVPLIWYQRHIDGRSRIPAITLKVLSKGVDTIRVARWVRRHDVVIVPGAGVLETTLPTRAWGLPYSLFLLCAFGKCFGTKVALVSVGANVMNQRMTKWLLNWAARLAFYRSYRDNLSRAAMRKRGLDTSHDRVYPDLVFGFPAPPDNSSHGKGVGVGLMAYYGGSDDRQHADQIYAQYIEKMKYFVGWLVDSGHQVRLFPGDSKFDDNVVQQVLDTVRSQRPKLDRASLVAESISSLEELMHEILLVNTMVATRYHNVVSALRLSKPTISIGYSAKHDVVMEDMGLSDFSQSIRSLDVDRLIKQFMELEGRSLELTQMLAERNTAKMVDLDRQFALLSSVLFPPASESQRVQAIDGLQDLDSPTPITRP